MKAILPKIGIHIPSIAQHLKEFLGKKDLLKLILAHALQLVEKPVNHGNDVNIEFQKTLPRPQLLTETLLPRSSISEQVVNQSRRDIQAILKGEDKRKIVMVGPCSIHDPAAGTEYARKLKELSEVPEIKKHVLIVMRCYFEKPRTTGGWKGLLSEPSLRGVFDVTTGFFVARAFLSKVTEIGLPTATEVLESITPQYIEDLVSWTAIGARTVESQTHRQLASGLSTPVGMKNATSGDIESALNAISAATVPSPFLGISQKTGRATEIHTKGNLFCHLVLRGGKNGPNYDGESLASIQARKEYRALTPAQQKIMVDCSHANSNKDHRRQAVVLAKVIESIKAGAPICGVMLESNLNEGNASSVALGELGPHGVSKTDACISFETTKKILLEAAKALD